MKMLVIAALAFASSVALAIPNNPGQQPGNPPDTPCADGATSTTWITVGTVGRSTVEEPVRAICEGGTWVIPNLPAAVAPAPATCPEGAMSTAWETGDNGRDKQQIPVQVVCHNNTWVPVSGTW